MSFFRRWRKSKSIIQALILIFIITSGLLFSLRIVYKTTENDCLKTLKLIAQQLNSDICIDLEREKQHLKIIADILSGYDDLESSKVQNALSSFEAYKYISRVDVLFPNDMLMMANGSYINVFGMTSFDEILSSGISFSDRDVDFNGSGQYVIHIYVPVYRQTEAVAILCGVVNLQEFTNTLNESVYAQDYNIYIIDGVSGSFVADTWHTELKNIYAFSGRKIADGYEFDRVRKDLRIGNAGYVVSFSEKANSNFYTYYEPMSINKWLIMLTSDEKVVLESAKKIRAVMFFYTLFQLFAFMIYIILVIIDSKKQNTKAEHQLSTIHFIYNIEKTLFNAHMNNDNINKALCKVSQGLNAESAFLIVLDKTAVKCLFTSHEEDMPLHLKSAKDIPREIVERLRTSSKFIEDISKNPKSMIIDNTKMWKENYTDEYELIKKLKISNIIITPIINIDQKITGLLGILNAKNKNDLSEKKELLENLNISFSMALNNIKVYQTIQNMGAMDLLTGILNRNSYQNDVIEYEGSKIKPCACVYVDANGLHELNNLLGHEAGDEMLRYIASVMKKEFGIDNVYRIGGDEFVAFVKHISKSGIEKKLDNLRKNVQSRQYNISVGMVYDQQSVSMQSMIKGAEQRMYADKRSYYNEKGDSQKARFANHKLEQLIMQKRDYQAFLSAIAPRFFGAYFVDMNFDSVRTVYIPKYFDEMLHECGGKYSAALNLYKERLVKPEYWEAFEKLLDYSYIEQQHDIGKIPELAYCKNDGVYLRLKIHRSVEYSEHIRETIWIFEMVSD